jgi:hypothetical protein
VAVSFIGGGNRRTQRKMNHILNQHSVVDSLLHCGFFKDFLAWRGFAQRLGITLKMYKKIDFLMTEVELQRYSSLDILYIAVLLLKTYGILSDTYHI